MKSMSAPVPPPSKIMYPVSNDCTPQGHQKSRFYTDRPFDYIFINRDPCVVDSHRLYYVCLFPTDTTIFKQRGLVDIFVFLIKICFSLVMYKKIKNKLCTLSIRGTWTRLWTNSFLYARCHFRLSTSNVIANEVVRSSNILYKVVEC